MLMKPKPVRILLDRSNRSSARSKYTVPPHNRCSCAGAADGSLVSFSALSTACRQWRRCVMLVHCTPQLAASDASDATNALRRRYGCSSWFCHSLLRPVLQVIPGLRRVKELWFSVRPFSCRPSVPAGLPSVVQELDHARPL